MCGTECQGRLPGTGAICSPDGRSNQSVAKLTRSSRVRLIDANAADSAAQIDCAEDAAECHNNRLKGTRLPD
jgi:hypothetical protein